MNKNLRTIRFNNKRTLIKTGFVLLGLTTFLIGTMIMFTVIMPQFGGVVEYSTSKLNPIKHTQTTFEVMVNNFPVFLLCLALLSTTLYSVLQFLKR